MGNLNAVAQGDLALAHVDVTAGAPTFDFNRGFSAIADTGPGVVTLTLSNAQNLTDNALVSVTPSSGATFAVATVEAASTTSIVVRTFDAAGAALDDIGFWIRVTPVSPE